MENDTPLMPLRKVHDLWAWAKADPSNTRDYICGLVAATADAVLAAMKHGRAGGWIFGQECFIRAVRAIRDLNAGGTVYTYGTDLAQRLPTNWRKLADAVESYARYVPRQMCWTGERPPDSIPRDIISPEHDKPIDSQALQAFFDYCIAKAKATFPAESALVETQYKTLVFNVPLNTTQTLSRLEAGQGEMHRRLQTAEERAVARHRETLAAIARVGADAKRGADAGEANGTKLDVITGRSTDPVISTSQMASMCGVTCRQVEHWEKRLKDPEHKNGRRPPRGYSLATRCDSGRAKVFADTYKSNRAFHAARGKPKRRSFDENRDAPDTSFADSLDNGAMDK